MVLLDDAAAHPERDPAPNGSRPVSEAPQSGASLIPRDSRAGREVHRLETLGRLSPGLAHELSTPAQFMGDTVSFLASALEGYTRVLAAYDELARQVEASLPDAVARVRAVEKDVNLRFLNQRTPGALARIESGVSRIADTARALSALSEPALSDGEVADVQLCLQRALTLLSADIRHVAVVKMSLPAPLAVKLAPRDLSDVVLNVLLNAIESVTAAGHRAKTGLVEIQGAARDDTVVLDIADNGVGVAEANRARIFEPDFTTKPARRGRGLAVVRDILRSAGGTIALVPPSAGSSSGAHFRLVLPAPAQKGAA